MIFKVGDIVRLRSDADLVGADMEMIQPYDTGVVTGIGWLDDDDVMVEFASEERTTRQCDPEWLEVIGRVERVA